MRDFTNCPTINKVNDLFVTTENVVNLWDYIVVDEELINIEDVKLTAIGVESGKCTLEDGVLTFRDRPLLVHEIDMQASVFFDGYVYGLVGLTVTEFCHTVKLCLRRVIGDPIKAGYLAGFGVERGFVTVRNVEDVVL